MTLFHRGFIRPNSNLLRWLAFSCFALPHYAVQTFESAMSEIAVILQPALELMSLTIEELAVSCLVYFHPSMYSIIFPSASFCPRSVTWLWLIS
jgi:hypothetical protein